MKHYVLFIYILIMISNSKFVFSKDIIGNEGIPSHWKRYHEPVNNRNHHRLSNKILDNKFNYETSLQDRNGISSPKTLPFHIVTQPTLNNLLYKNLLSNLNVDARKSPSPDNDKAAGKQNVESNKAGNTNENNEKEKTSKNANTENTFNPSDKMTIRRGNSEQKPMNIMHHHRKIPLRQIRQMDSSSYPEKSEFRDENIEKESDVEELQKSKQMTRRTESEKSENIQKDNDETEEFPRKSDLEEKKQIDDNGRRTGNFGLIQPMYMHPFNDPIGWVRYRFMPNQYALSNGNYISRLYPYTKDSGPLYKQQG